ncbi:MAG: hypothetical protein HZA51_06470 [Planctomycetes bacterium]|nr:hypothetical protein [Planctomycetota bacterium]
MIPRITSQDRELIRRAFLAVRNNWPPDRVVADSELNAAFLVECERLGVSAPDRERNRVLLNIRKAGLLQGIKSQRTTFANQDQYQFAAEIAVRLLERRDGVTLDDILCDPKRVAEFDRLAQEIAPGFSPLQYRWAALSIRKSSGLKPEPASRTVPAIEVRRFATAGINIRELPDENGVYLFQTTTKLLYVGEAANLRVRLSVHLDHSDNRQLARWIWENENEPLFIECHVLPAGTSKRTRRAVELEFIRSRKPEFNIQR